MKNMEAEEQLFHFKPTELVCMKGCGRSEVCVTVTTLVRPVFWMEDECDASHPYFNRRALEPSNLLTLTFSSTAVEMKLGRSFSPNHRVRQRCCLFQAPASGVIDTFDWTAQS